MTSGQRLLQHLCQLAQQDRELAEMLESSGRNEATWYNDRRHLAELGFPTAQGRTSPTGLVRLDPLAALRALGLSAAGQQRAEELAQQLGEAVTLAQLLSAAFEGLTPAPGADTGE